MNKIKKVDINFYKKSIIDCYNNFCMPGQNAHKKMVPLFPQNQPEYFKTDSELREAAVLIILFEQEKKTKTILIERMPDAGPHSGQIAFPGGRKENFDRDLADTAIREAYEEIGLKLFHENIIANLTPVAIPISGFSVTPFVGVINYIPKFILSEDEVKRIYILDLEKLMNSEKTLEISVRGMTIKAPGFVFDKGFIWGATAMVIKELKEIIIHSISS